MMMRDDLWITGCWRLLDHTHTYTHNVPKT